LHPCQQYISSVEILECPEKWWEMRKK
jgi:hypothetical protein